MKSYFKIWGLLVIVLLCTVGLSACGNNEEPTNSEPESKSIGNFDYPDKSAFVFTADIQESTVKKGEPFIIHCSLKNTTDRDFFIKHGTQTITYLYNDDSEILNAIALFDTFKQGGTIDRELSIPAKKTGAITVTATIYITPEKYSDVSTQQEYKYTKTIDVTVR